MPCHWKVPCHCSRGTLWRRGKGAVFTSSVDKGLLTWAVPQHLHQEGERRWLLLGNAIILLYFNLMLRAFSWPPWCPVWWGPCQAIAAYLQVISMEASSPSLQNLASWVLRNSRTFPGPKQNPSAKLTWANSHYPYTDRQELLWSMLSSLWSVIYWWRVWNFH